MEIPKDLKTLYKHWKKHTQKPQIDVSEHTQVPQDLKYFISERMRVWERKTNGDKPPFTKDNVLQKFRFCNIYRELDKQTIQIHKDLKAYEDNFSLWLLNLCFHRFVSRPETIFSVGHLSFDRKTNEKVFKKLKNIPSPKYGNAYVFPISVIQKSKTPTREEFFCFCLPKAIKKISPVIQGFNNLSVNEALSSVLPQFEFNFKFHWTEILIDIAYQYPDKIDLFKDFYIGPGALPTAKAINPSTSPVELVNQCIGVDIKDFPYLTYEGQKVYLSAENWEGIFCEYRKYSNLKRGMGRIRKYTTRNV
ncbi:MAG: nucleotide kinase domain-containing protein [Patescibacteria group bacterium]|nr:hypothetical protein [Patescibacteria group bacterium]